MTSFWEILKSSKSLKASDAFAELWGKSIADSWDIITITGTLPLTFEAKGEALKNYRLYGTSEGAGVQTANLFDKDAKNTDNGYVANYYLAADGSVIESTGYYISEYMLVSPNTEYTISVGARYNNPSVCIYDETKTYIEGFAYGRNNPKTITTGATAKYIRISFFSLSTSITAVMKSSDMSDPYIYIPYGYKLPLTVTSGEQSDTYPVYIGDTQLMDEEYVDYQEQKVWKMVDGTLTPTDPPVPLPEITAYKGENTLSSTETVGEVSVTGKIKEI